MNSSILSQIDFAKTYSEVEPKSIAGQALRESHLNKIAAVAPSHLLVSDIVNECLVSQDEALVEFASNVVKSINAENETKFRFGMILEMAHVASQSNKLIVPLYENLLKLNEMSNDNLHESIRRGALDNMTWYDPIRQLNEHINRDSRSQNITNEAYAAYTPISYVEEHNDKTFLMVESAVIAIDQFGDVAVSNDTMSAKFKRINEAIARTPYDPAKRQFFATTLLGTVDIDGNGHISLDNQPIDALSLRESFKDSISNSNMSQTRLAEQYVVADDLCLIAENFDNLMQLDSIKVAKSLMMNESMSCIVLNDKASILEIKKGTARLNKVDSINEAVSKFETVSGISLNEHFNDALAKEHVLNESIENERKETLAGLNEALNEVETSMDKCDNGSPRYNELSTIRESIENEIEKLNEGQSETFETLSGSKITEEKLTGMSKAELESMLKQHNKDDRTKDKFEPLVTKIEKLLLRKFLEETDEMAKKHKSRS